MRPSRAASLPLLAMLTAAPRAQIERPIPYPLPESPGWEQAVKNGTRTATGAPGPSYWTNHARYKIRAELEPATAILTGHVKVTWENHSPKPVRRIAVHLRQNLHKAGTARNSFVEITGGVTTSKLRIDGKEAGKRSVTTRGTVMTIRLGEPVAPGKEVTIAMDWKYRVPKKGAPRNGHENFHVYYLGYWYPQIAVLDDVEGWVAEQYMGTGEFYMDYADYDVAFTAPRGWLVRATGELTNSRDVLTRTERARLAKARTSRDIVHVITPEELAAGKVTRRGKKKLTWRYRARNVRDVAVSVSDRYVWDATHAVIAGRNGPGRDGIAMIHAVYRPKARSFERAAEFARHTIEYMSKTVYPYQWPHMTACEGVVGGGMEYPMMTICGGGGRSVQGVVTHELIHMWFPMLVGTNEKAYAWQDEGLTSFFTNLTVAAFRSARRRPGADRDRGQRRRRPRRRGFAARRTLAPIMRHGDRFPGRGTYSIVSYAKTSAVLAQLRALVGDETFFAAMRRYVADWRFKHPYPADFFHTFNTASGQDLDWYWRIWFYETWTLDQGIESVHPNAGGTEVVVADLGLATHPTTVAVTYADGESETRHIDVHYWLSGKKRKRIRLGPHVKKIVLDPQHENLDIARGNDVWESGKGG